MSQWITIREKDGQVCSLPTDQERATWIATYLQNVTGKRYTIRPHVDAAAAFEQAIRSDPTLTELFAKTP